MVVLLPDAEQGPELGADPGLLEDFPHGGDACGVIHAKRTQKSLVMCDVAACVKGENISSCFLKNGKKGTF